MIGSAPEKVLIIKPSSLGDVVSGIPVLRGLRRSFPEARLAWMVVPGCADILTGESQLDEVIEFDRRHFGRIGRALAPTRDFLRFCRELRRRRFDWVIDLQGLFRSGYLAWATRAPLRAGFANAREKLARMFYTHRLETTSQHTIDRNIELAQGLGIDARPEDLTVTPTEDASRKVASWLAKGAITPGEFLLVIPGTRWRTKLYPIRHWRRVMGELARRHKIVLAGSPDDRALCAELADASAVDLTGRTSLGELVAVIASAAAVICCDSAANFIAPAMGTPSVTLIGPTRSERTGPYGPLARGLVATTPCQGCTRRECSHVTCMQTISPDAVIAAVEQALSRPNGVGAGPANP